jgi:hypothetical protein
MPPFKNAAPPLGCLDGTRARMQRRSTAEDHRKMMAIK